MKYVSTYKVPQAIPLRPLPVKGEPRAVYVFGARSDALKLLKESVEKDGRIFDESKVIETTYAKRWDEVTMALTYEVEDDSTKE